MRKIKNFEILEKLYILNMTLFLMFLWGRWRDGGGGGRGVAQGVGEPPERQSKHFRGRAREAGSAAEVLIKNT